MFSYIDAESSDLYVIPRFRTAFVNPFTEQPTLDILCSFYTKDGKPLESAPEYILKKASILFTKETGYTFKAMGELEYYIISDKNVLYPAKDQRGYHTAAPFTNWESLRLEVLQIIAQSGGKVKYGIFNIGFASISCLEDPTGCGYNIQAEAQSSGWVKIFRNLNYHFECCMDLATGLPISAIRSLRDGRYNLYNELIFDQYSRIDSAIVFSQMSGKHVVSKNIYDILTGFYHFRMNFSLKVRVE